MGIVASFVGYYLYRAVDLLMGRSKTSTLAGGFVGAWASVFVASVVCAVELALSGKFPLGIALPAMGGHPCPHRHRRGADHNGGAELRDSHQDEMVACRASFGPSNGAPTATGLRFPLIIPMAAFLSPRSPLFLTYSHFDRNLKYGYNVV